MSFRTRIGRLAATGLILSLAGGEGTCLIPNHELDYPDKEERGRGQSQDPEKDTE